MRLAVIESGHTQVIDENEVASLRQRVAKLERTVEFLLQYLHLNAPDAMDNPVSQELIDLVRRGKKIEAIKLYREQTGLGLKEAKAFIDRLDT